jgi:pilus assembly protein Flp/PilA
MTRFSLDRLTAKLRNKEEGVTALEYALIAALIAVAIIGAVRFAGTSASTSFKNTADAMNGANAPAN